MTFLWVWLLSCSNDQDRWKEDLKLQWASSPEQTIIDLSQDTNPIAVLAKVQFLIEQHPGKTSRLCPLLKDQPARKRCERLNERPHLWSKSKQEPSNISEHPFHKQAPKALTCPSEQTAHECIAQQAMEAARFGNIQEVVKICENEQTATWRGECYFSSAEALIKRKLAHGYSQATELCFAADPFVENCHNHLILELAQLAPSSYTPHKEDWQTIFSAANAVDSAWRWKDPQRAENIKSRLWSEALGEAYAFSKPVSGDPVDALPKELLPHIRSAATKRLLSIDSPDSLPLNGWLKLVKEALKTRHQGSAHRDQKQKFIAAENLYLDRIEGIDSIAYMATSERPTHENEDLDLIFCILEAAARRPPHNQKLLNEALEHSNTFVQKRAEQLLQLTVKDVRQEGGE
ncbi:MAG: hypothetical protein CMK59_04885 [Proteobacteria bacterium]|nr:hypothetical protein [Pseudomonadota bacterium]